MGEYREVVAHFSKMRDYLREFFIYGFRTGSEIGVKSGRTSSDEKHRIESFLDGYVGAKVGSDKRKRVFISVDSAQVYENPFYNAFYNCGFNNRDIKLHFFILDILSAKEHLSVPQISERLYSYLDDDDYIDSQTVKIKLDEYVREGLLERDTSKTPYLYYLSSPSAHELFDEIDGLADSVKLFSSLAPFGELGDSMLKDADQKNDIFRFKHSYLVYALEDEILFSLTECINEDCSAVLSYTDRNGKESLIDCVPLKIYTSSQTGRRYLIAYYPFLDKLSAYRLDRIKSVTITNPCKSCDAYRERLAHEGKSVFGVTFANSGQKPIHFAMTLYIDEQKEPYVVTRLEREKRCGTVTPEGNGIYKYEAQVYDPKELMQWVKSFIGRIIKIECDNPQLIQDFENDITQMFKMYGDKNE